MEKKMDEHHQEEEEEEEEMRAQVEIWKYTFGFTNMAVVKCAIELGIAEALHDHGGPMSLQQLSSTLGCDQTTLHRIMRYLVHYNFFKYDGTNTTYALNPLSKRLLKNDENSMADFILLESSPVMLAAWHGLSSRVLANAKEPAFEAAHGVDVWKCAAANSRFCKLIDDAMACNARLAVRALIKGCAEVFDGVGRLVDVGGGNGTALRLLVKAFPWIKGVNFDAPHVVSAAKALASADDACLEYVGGDFFESVPQADATYLMWVLHDWNDEDCVKILRNCKEAIPKDKGKVIIVEAVVGQQEEEEGSKDELEFVRLMLDMVMIAHSNYGKERTSKEWDFLLREAGFSRYTITPIAAVQSLIVAFP